MLWLKILLGIVVVIAGYVLIAGSVVARSHVATVCATFARPPAEIWAAITDHASQPAWRKELKSLEMQPSRDGRTFFRETGPFGPVNFIVDASEPQGRYVVRILDEHLSFGGRWIYELEPAGSGSRLTITEEGEVKSLFFRALSPFFSKTSTIEGFLRALGAKFGETVAAEVVRKS
jgi:uncharacterized protein YndB with AHSA1/START domain